MRQELREGGQHVPRSNSDLIEAYKKFTTPTENGPETIDPPVEKPPVPTVKLVSSNIYTYVGTGDAPPHKIKFMNIQWFTRGLSVEVKPEILEKVRKNASFVKGKVDMETYYEQDEIEKKRAEEQRKVDRQIQAQADRLNRGQQG